MNRDVVKKELLLGYFFLSPIYWIPGIGNVPLFWFKTFYLFGLILLFFPAGLSALGKTYIQSKNGAILFLLALLTGLYVAFFYDSSIPSIVNAIIFIFFFVFAGYLFSARNIALDVGPYSFVCLLILLLLLARVVLAIVFPGLDIQNESNTYSEYLGVDFYLPLSISGYNLGRTGWAISLILLASFLAYVMAFNRVRAIRWLLLLLIALASICVALSTSRTGVVGIGFFVLLYFLLPKGIQSAQKPASRFRVLKVIVGLLALAAVFGYVMLNFGEQTRFDVFLQSSDIDVISNGRFSGVEVALGILENDFWFGTYPTGAYNLLDYGIPYAAVHMVWLHLAATYGVLLALAWLLAVAVLSVRAIHACLMISRRGEPQYLFLFYMLLFGIFSTLTEPETIISSATHVAIYWFVIGYVCQKQRQDTRLNP